MKLELKKFTWLIPVIEEKSYTSKQSISDGEKEEEMIETDMDDSELENFKNEWVEKWKPSIREDEPGILTRFFKIHLPDLWIWLLDVILFYLVKQYKKCMFDINQK